MLNRLWKEEVGAIVSAEIMMVATILVIGVVVGLKSVRDSVVTELGDVAQAIANFNQSYSISATSGHHAYTAGASFHDRADFCDDPTTLTDVNNSKCVLICTAAHQPSCVGTGDGSELGGAIAENPS